MSEENVELTKMWFQIKKSKPAVDQLEFMFTRLKGCAKNRTNDFILEELTKMLLKSKPSQKCLCEIIIFNKKFRIKAFEKLIKLNPDCTSVATLLAYAPENLKTQLTWLKEKNDNDFRLIGEFIKKLK